MRRDLKRDRASHKVLERKDLSMASFSHRYLDHSHPLSTSFRWVMLHLRYLASISN